MWRRGWVRRLRKFVRNSRTTDDVITHEAGDGSRADDAAELTEPQIRYLAVLRVKPSVGCGMRLAGVRFANLKGWRESARFRELENEATEIGKGVLFVAMRKSAVEGDLVPVCQSGLLVGHKRKFCARMREMLAKALMPAMFDPKVLNRQPARPTVILGTAEQIAKVVRRFSPTARRTERPVPGDGSSAPA